MTGQLQMTNLSRLSGTILLGALTLGPCTALPQDAATTVTPAAATPVVQAPASQGQESSEPQTLHLLVGRSLVITSPSRIKRVSLADPEIAEAIPVSPTP